jgi:hypothetical protein
LSSYHGAATFRPRRLCESCGNSRQREFPQAGLAGFGT